MDSNLISSSQRSATHPIVPDFEAVKVRQQGIWASGDYGRIGIRLQIVGESLCEAVNLLSGERVLDVAAGNGNASLAAARRFADVTSTDYVGALLDQGRVRAEADGLAMEFVTSDAEQLPFGDDSFDVVLSTFGVMFTPDQDRAASEMLRVVRPGGRIGLANWTPEGFIGQLFRVISAYVPPPEGVRSPLLWGTEPRLVELFGPRATDIRTVRKEYVFRYRSAEHWIDEFLTYYGPTLRGFASLEESRKPEFRGEILKLLNRLNRNQDALVIPSEYIEAVITR